MTLGDTADRSTDGRALAKVAAADPRTVAERAELEPPAAAVLCGGSGVEAGLRALIAAGLDEAAAAALAQALPKREAVWWACLAARDGLADSPDAAAEEPILAAAEAWVLRPEDGRRRAAMAGAEAAGFTTPAAWCAAAAFWSGGSISAPDLPEVLAEERLTGVAVACAVAMVRARGAPTEMAARGRRLLRQGLDIAAGGSGRSEPPGGGRR